MAKHILSKSSFIRGVQCHKSLYLYKKRYFLRDRLSAEQQSKFKRGTNVGLLARQLFPGGIDVSPPTPFQYAKSVDRTSELIAQGFPVIYEAAFRYKGVLVALDILEHKNGKWYGYEVKSSLSVSETYKLDAALQYFVISGSGLMLEDICIIYMNKEYVAEGELDLERLFLKQSMLEEAFTRKEMIEQEIEAQLRVVDLPKSPQIDIGLHCNIPYPCDFQGHCRKHLPRKSVFDLQWLSEEQRFDLYYRGIYQLDQIPTDYFTYPDQTNKLNAHRVNTPHFQKDSVTGCLRDVEYPLAFLFAWYHRPAVPLYEGTKPYAHMPFFMASGVLMNQEDDMKISYTAFEPESNPLIAFSGRITEIASKAKCLIVFGDPVLSVNSSDFSNFIEGLPVIINLAAVLDKGYYYHPSTDGNHDIFTIGTRLLKLPLQPSKVFGNGFEALMGFMESYNKDGNSDAFLLKMKQTADFNLASLKGFFRLLSNL